MPSVFFLGLPTGRPAPLASAMLPAKRGFNSTDYAISRSAFNPATILSSSTQGLLIDNMLYSISSPFLLHNVSSIQPMPKVTSLLKILSVRELEQVREP
jgi:hypothetical protein